jgi:valyl-tRNA synthetase
VHGEAIIALPLAGIIDLNAERLRLEKEMARIGADVDQIASRLANDGFVAKAPEHVLEETRERKIALESRRQRISDALRRLSQAG